MKPKIEGLSLSGKKPMQILSRRSWHQLCDILCNITQYLLDGRVMVVHWAFGRYTFFDFAVEFCGTGGPLLWRHNVYGSVSNYQPRDCLLKHLFRRRLKKTSKLRDTGLCAGNSPETGEFPAQMASNAENVSIR